MQKNQRNNSKLIAGLVKWYNGSFVMISWEFDPLIQHHSENQSNVLKQSENLVVKTWASGLFVFLCKRITLDCGTLVWCELFLALGSSRMSVLTKKSPTGFSMRYRVCLREKVTLCFFPYLHSCARHNVTFV